MLVFNHIRIHKQKGIKMANSKKVQRPKKWLIPLAIFVLFGGIGAYFLVTSRAATPEEPLVVISSAYRAKSIDPSLELVTDYVAYTGNDDQVVRLVAGKTANFTVTKGGGGTTLFKNCYFMRAPEKAATVEITGWSRKRTVKLTTDQNYYYQKYCIETQPGNYLGYNVKVLSGGPVYIYQLHAELINACTTKTFQVVGTSDRCIKFAQRLLNYHVFALDSTKYLPVDGVYSEKVKDTVKAAQTSYKKALPEEYGNQEIDGIIDPSDTWFIICNPLKGPPPAWFTESYNYAGCTDFRGPK
jgi:hypothetical protein